MLPRGEAAALNNQGVDCLASGNLSGALVVMKQALEMKMGDASRVMTLPTEASHKNGVSTYEEVDPETSRCKIEISCDLDTWLPQGPRVVALVPETCSQYVRAQGICLSTSPGSFSSNDLVDAHLSAAIIVYNMALLFQLQGLAGCDKQSENRLRKALLLYTRVLSLLRYAGLPLDVSSGHAILDILTGCVYNNMGYAYFQLGDYESCRDCMDTLCTLARTIVPSSQCKNQETAAILALHKSFFLINAVSLKAPDLASAA